MKRLLLMILFSWCTVSLNAAWFEFDRITSNADVNVESQFRLEVFETGTGAAFKFYNDGPVDSCISEIYFYDGTLLEMYTIDDSCEGVDFEDLGEATDPAFLPGYAAAPLMVLSATEAQNPKPHNGINPGEWLTISFLLDSESTFQDLLDALAVSQAVVGIHVQAIEPSGGDFSDSFITPEPTTLVLLCAGSLVLTRKRR